MREELTRRRRIVTRLRAGQSGVRSPAGGDNFSVLQTDQTGSGAHPASCSMSSGSHSEVKRPRRGADHLCPSTAEVRNEWSYASTPPTRFHGAHRDSFTPFTENRSKEGRVRWREREGSMIKLMIHSQFI